MKLLLAPALLAFTLALSACIDNSKIATLSTKDLALVRAFIKECTDTRGNSVQVREYKHPLTWELTCNKSTNSNKYIFEVKPKRIDK